MIWLYEKEDESKVFERNGIALKDCLEASMVKEINGLYEVEIIYPIEGRAYKYLKKWNLIKAKGQLFRIYSIRKRDSQKAASVLARHIFYDLFFEDVPIYEVEEVSPYEAFSSLLTGNVGSKFSGTSDIGTFLSLSGRETNKVDLIFKMLEAIGEGELYRDNYNIAIKRRLGSDNGVSADYGKNILDLESTDSSDKVVTRIIPIGDSDLILPEYYIPVPILPEDKPPFEVTRVIRFNGSKQEATLRSNALAYAEALAFQDINLKVDFLSLANAEEFNKFKQLQVVDLGDDIGIRHPRLKVQHVMRVIKTTEDLLTGKKTVVELGRKRDSLLDAITNKVDTGAVKDEVVKQIDEERVNGLEFKRVPYAKDLIINFEEEPGYDKPPTAVLGFEYDFPRENPDGSEGLVPYQITPWGEVLSRDVDGKIYYYGIKVHLPDTAPDEIKDGYITMLAVGQKFPKYLTV